MAFSVDVVLCLWLSRAWPCALNSHAPGPVPNTVFIPLRKSGTGGGERERKGERERERKGGRERERKGGREESILVGNDQFECALTAS